MSKVLMVLSSHGELGDTGTATGWFLPEAAHPYAVFRRAGIDVDFLSPLGGEPPMEGGDRTDPLQAAFLDDPEVQKQLSSTLTPSQVEVGDYDAILFIGGHGPMFDFADNAELQDITRQVWERGAAVAAVCHGPAGLVNVRLSDGTFLVAGKTLTSFTDEEERADGLESVVPFLLASTLTERGATHVPAANFAANVQVDGRLVTGQNPASATPLSEALVTVIRSAGTPS